MDEDHLVALAVPEERVHRRGRPAERDLDVVVPHQQLPPGQRVAAGVDVPGLQVERLVLVRHPLVALDRLEAAEPLDAARRGEVVEDRLVPREPLEAHDLLGEQRAVVAELDVALARHLAETLVERHDSILGTWPLGPGPRRASRGSASSSAGCRTAPSSTRWPSGSSTRPRTPSGSSGRLSAAATSRRASTSWTTAKTLPRNAVDARTRRHEAAGRTRRVGSRESTSRLERLRRASGGGSPIDELAQRLPNARARATSAPVTRETPMPRSPSHDAKSCGVPIHSLPYSWSLVFRNC